MKRKTSMCDKCKERFDEDDLDFHEGKWLCRNCEHDEMHEEERDEMFGGVF